MNDIQSLNQTSWDCKYHIVWIPKCQRKALCCHLCKDLGDVFDECASRKNPPVPDGATCREARRGTGIPSGGMRETDGT